MEKISSANSEKKLWLPQVQRFGSHPNPNLACHVTSITHPLIHRAGGTSLGDRTADRWYRAEYKLFNYFYTN